MKRIGVAIATALVLAALVVVVGRWEAHRWADRQNAGIAHVRALAGPIGGTRLSGYRLDWAFDCLLYVVGEQRFGAELCFDASGRIVEGISRSGEPRYWTLRMQPSRAALREPPSLVACLLRAIGAPVARGATTIPLHTLDQGVAAAPAKRKARCPTGG